jgi:hypothetical protein
MMGYTSELHQIWTGTTAATLERGYLAYQGNALSVFDEQISGWASRSGYGRNA